MGWENFANIAIYLENGTRWGHTYYRTLIGSHRWPIDPCQFQWPWKADGAWMVRIFWPISIITLERFDLEVGRSIFFKGPPRPHPWGGPHVPQMFGTYLRPNGLT